MTNKLIKRIKIGCREENIGMDGNRTNKGKEKELILKIIKQKLFRKNTKKDL